MNTYEIYRTLQSLAETLEKASALIKGLSELVKKDEETLFNATWKE